MNRKQVIKDIIVEQHNSRKKRKLVSREMVVPIDTDKILVVSGVRRCGKTSLLYLLREKIIKSGVSIRNTLFLSFDDERISLQVDELDLILQAYRELYPKLNLEDCYFFFDEIQNVNGWERFVRRLYDNVSNRIFISGSNSQQLGSEIATSLRGRTIQYELYPLSFKEYLNFKGIEHNYYGDTNKTKIINEFRKYLLEGGFPETLNKDSELRNRILNDYYQVLLFRDIVERYNVTRIYALKYYIKKLLSNLGKPFSINKIYNELKSQGVKIDKAALYDILEYIEAVYLGLRLYRFDYSVVNREMGDKKMYVIDNGLINAITYKFSNDYGTLLENQLFVYLRKKYGENLFYYSKKQECDFVVFEKDRAKQCIQVSYDVSEKSTLDRELKGLLNAMEYFHTDNGIIITMEYEDTVEIKGKIIRILPAYKAMIDDV